MDVRLRDARRARCGALWLGFAMLVCATPPSYASEDTTVASAAGEAAVELAGPPVPSPRPSASPAAASPRLGAWRTDAVLVTAGQVADLVSTEIALSRPGTREGNALLGSRAVRIPAKLGVAAATSLACYELRRSDHHGTARALSIVSLAVGAAAAVHNLRVAR